MPRIDTGLPHQLAYRQRFSRGCRLLGCACLVAGAMLISAPWLAPETDLSPAELRGCMLLGAAAAALGVALLFGRRGKLFDKQQGTLALWWGVLRPWRQSVYDLQSFTMLVVSPDRVAEPARWQIALGTAAGERLTIFELSRESAARIAVAEIAGFLGLPAIVVAPAAPPAEGIRVAADEPVSSTSSPAPATTKAGHAAAETAAVEKTAAP